MFKKINIVFLFSFLMLAFFGCGLNNVIVIYNWGEYLNPELKEKFKKEYNISVREVTFDSSQVAETSLKTRNKYDIVFATEFSVHNLKNEKIGNKPLIQKIDWSKIETKKTAFDSGLNFVVEKLKNKFNYDLLDYMVPYAFGTIGILFNADKVDVNEVIEKEWDIIKKTKTKDNLKLKTAIYNSAIEFYSIALKAIGKDVENATIKDIDLASKWLDNVPDQNRKFVTDAIFDDVPNKKIDLVFTISGEASEIIWRTQEENLDLNLKYYVPKKKGTSIWLDGIIIPRNSNTSYAYKFINFLLDEENAKMNVDEIGFSSPIKSVLEQQKEEAYEDINNSEYSKFQKNAAQEIYNILNIVEEPKHEVFLYDKINKKYIDNRWLEFLAKSSAIGWWKHG